MLSILDDRSRAQQAAARLQVRLPVCLGGLAALAQELLPLLVDIRLDALEGVARSPVGTGEKSDPAASARARGATCGEADR